MLSLSLHLKPFPYIVAKKGKRPDFPLHIAHVLPKLAKWQWYHFHMSPSQWNQVILYFLSYLRPRWGLCVGARTRQAAIVR